MPVDNASRFLRGLNKLLGVEDTSNSIETAQVSSTCLSEVSYDRFRMVLTVTFVESGATYEYFSVPESEYENLVTTFGSIGEQYNSDIKGVYPYLRIS